MVFCVGFIFGCVNSVTACVVWFTFGWSFCWCLVCFCCLHWLLGLVCFVLGWLLCDIISVFVVLCCYLLGFFWFLGVVLCLLFRLVDWLVLVLVIGVVVHLLRSFYGIVFCELSGMIGECWL